MSDCISKFAKRPLLYTDALGGEQTCRDDLWVLTTEELNSIAVTLSMAECTLAAQAALSHGWDYKVYPNSPLDVVRTVLNGGLMEENLLSTAVRMHKERNKK